jgi:hypothetical protein
MPSLRVCHRSKVLPHHQGLDLARYPEKAQADPDFVPEPPDEAITKPV